MTNWCETVLGDKLKLPIIGIVAGFDYEELLGLGFNEVEESF